MKKFAASHQSLKDSFGMFFVDMSIFLEKYLDYPLRCAEGQIIAVQAHLKEIAEELQKKMSVRVNSFDEVIFG